MALLFSFLTPFTFYFNKLPSEEEPLLLKLREESRAVFLQRRSRELLDNDELQVRSAFFYTLSRKPWFFHVGSTNLLKTLWKKEKLLVTSNFSFSHILFYLLGEISAICIKFEIVCKLFKFGRV